MGDTETTFLNNPDSYLAILTPDQLIDEYPGQFMRATIERNMEITFELSRNNREHDQKERVFCSRTNICLIESDDTYNIWDLDMTDKKVLNSINSKVIGLGIRNGSDRKKAVEEMIIPDYGRFVKVTYLPKTVESSNFLIEMLNRRREFLQK